ncbi:DUF1295-domain-containing protein [Gonapodya prolifera JEL478]|uniref:DUF1295-domain-containing protein n=1 Tax=Gonapodya prolifera (strain JEL478) TaxID=1344416 RepID=A0A139ANI2_GONPJ|nr:DUF1295-domain-containing protein [Gonapodya prolifera JEL478]|eukprot:KXS18299.1 DUF1295-domain-containing protein [Gonapodya prolifera JEL478]
MTAASKPLVASGSVALLYLRLLQLANKARVDKNDFPKLQSFSFSPILQVLALDVGIQAACFVIANALKTEMFYDFSGSVTYLACIAWSLLSRQDGQVPNDRQLFSSAMGSMWASRLGTYLLERILQHGKDERFDNIKPSVARFAFAWAMQSVWIFLVGSPIYVVNTIPPSEQPLTSTVDMVGRALWVLGFVTEAIADYQKSTFKLINPNEHGPRTGLYALSRHPNYVGEVLLWTGIAISAAPALKSWQYFTFLSPIFSYFLLRNLSGVPMVEKGWVRRYSKDVEFQKWFQNTPVFWPRLW